MTPSPGICAIILAAGYSRRMQRFKPLLTLDGKTVLERVVALYRTAGLTDVRVVTGFRSEAIRSSLADAPVSVIHNPTYATGMFSSVLAGVDTLSADIRFFFVHPVDIPLVRPHTLKVLMDVQVQHPSPVVYPVFDDRRGHPPLISRELKDIILSHDGSGGLRTILRRFDSASLDVLVADEGICLDLDTPDDFKHLSDRMTASDTLSENECRVLMEKVSRLPESLIGHCLQVARVAETLALAVNGKGGAINVSMVRAAALVHDVARLEKNHAASGAELLDSMGFAAMAAIVAAHMDIDRPEESALDETQIVHLADKLVAGKTVVGLSQRFDEKLKKYGHDPNLSAAIRRRRRMAFLIQEKVEQASGRPINRILTKAGYFSEPAP